MKQTLSEQELAVLRSNPLFRGLDRAQLDRQLAVMKAEKTHEVCVDDIEGSRMIMAEVTAGNSFAESLCFLRTKESPVYIFASEDSELLWLSTEDLYAGSDAFYREIQQRFTATLAMKALTMNNRIQVLSKLSLRGKLTAYFTELAAAQGSSVIRLPMNREDTAAYIGANRSALSRELMKMKEEGLIDYRKNEIRILR